MIFIASVDVLGEPAATEPASAMQRRAVVLRAGREGLPALGELVAAMKDPDAMVRRASIRALGQIGKPAADALKAALSDEDVLVRISALQALVPLEGDQSADILARALKDEDARVRTAALELADLLPRTAAVTDLLQQAARDPDSGVSRLANTLLHGLFETAKSVRQNPLYKDHILRVIQRIPLPAEGWRFKTDPKKIGDLSGWYKADFQDKDWMPIRIEADWESQGHDDYDGIAWYRGAFTLPARMDQAGTDIVFEGVDEGAWVWINGEFVGSHDIGPAGWDVPFAADVTKVLKWGEKNQITVRVLDTAFAGGIWKPVHLDVLKE
jgi:hypothetical protein